MKDGAVFAFGLSEREHGADIYSTEMTLTPQPDGSYRANGEKYYIGNGNDAPMVSTFGKMADSGEYVFFAADSRKPGYELLDNVVATQAYVSAFALHDYPVTEADILSRGREAWDAALNTVNIGKFNLGWASIGICDARALRGDQPRRQPPSLQHVRHRFPARQADVHRRLRAPGGDEAFHASGRRLHAGRVAGRPALPPLQPRGEDEGDDAGGGGHQTCSGTSSRPRASRRTCTSRAPPWTSAPCRSSRARST